MIRQTFRALFAIATIALLIEAAAGRQPNTQDRIVVRNAAKNDGSTVAYEGASLPVGLQVLTSDKAETAKSTGPDLVN